MIDCPSTTPSLTYIQLSYMFVNNNTLHVSLNISNTLVDMYMKLHTHLDFDGPICTVLKYYL